MPKLQIAFIVECSPIETSAFCPVTMREREKERERATGRGRERETGREREWGREREYSYISRIYRPDRMVAEVSPGPHFPHIQYM